MYYLCLVINIINKTQSINYFCGNHIIRRGVRKEIQKDCVNKINYILLLQKMVHIVTRELGKINIKEQRVKLNCKSAEQLLFLLAFYGVTPWTDIRIYYPNENKITVFWELNLCYLADRYQLSRRRHNLLISGYYKTEASGVYVISVYFEQTTRCHN